MTRQYRVVALPGEGIGPEVVEASLMLLQAIAQHENFSITIDWGWIGKPAFHKFGSNFPDATAHLCDAADGIVFGAVSQGGLLELRQRFNFFVNLRPVRPSPNLLSQSSLKVERLRDVDILFVRELVSGIYFGWAGRAENERGCYGYHTMQYYDDEIQQIARVALQHAQNRRQLLSVAHKENALPHLPWTRLVQEEAQAFPEVVVEPMLIDNLAMQLVMNPQRFDVVLAGNLFGDILSDMGGALVGSIGLLGSASLNPDGLGLYEAIHGTAPGIAGQGIANPLGTLAGIVLMLEQWEEREAARKLISAQEQILAKGYRTADLNPQNREMLVTTQELVELLLRELNRID